MGTEDDPAVEKVRASVSFDSSILGIRHILFHYYFIEHVSRSLGHTIEEMATKYVSLQVHFFLTNHLYESLPAFQLCQDLRPADQQDDRKYAAVVP